jgi:hypothetical protein
MSVVGEMRGIGSARKFDDERVDRIVIDAMS